MTIAITPEAWEEVHLAARAYELERTGLGDRFLDDFEAAVDRIEKSPVTHSLYEFLPPRHGVRRRRLRRFPYLVVFRFDSTENSVRVIAVPHASRKPGYWRDRL